LHLLLTLLLFYGLLGVGVGLITRTVKGDNVTLLKDGRGLNRVSLKNKNRDTLRAWKNDNKNGTMQECIADTKLSYKTIVRHLKAIDKETQA
jgi:hypothetical protein